MPRARSTFDWATALDLDLAVTHCHYDILGDWYRDPWGWPELAWVVKRSPALVVARLNDRGVKRSARLDVPKENFGIRPAIIMDPLDRLAYQAIVDRCVPKLQTSLKPWAFMGRLARKGQKRAGQYADGGAEDELYRDYLISLVERYDYALATDIVSFFASVPMDRLEETVFARVGESKLTERLIDMLSQWDSMPSRSGLPQRFIASSVLANAYLQPLDDVLTAFSGPRARSVPHYRVARWMDDIWLFGPDESKLRRAQIEVGEVMRSLGLNINLAKTKLLEGDAADEEIRRRQHSAVDKALARDEQDYGPLDALLDGIFAASERAERPRIRFATRRMRRAAYFGRVGEFVDQCPRMPHAADILARLFRDSGAWAEIQDWFVEYAKSDWATEWSVGQLATMFPSSKRPGAPLRAYLSEQIGVARSPVLVAAAAQRIAAWEPDNARAIIREAMGNAEHPLQRRILALAALGAGEDRSWIRTQLSEFDENRVTLEMVRAGRRSLRQAADFSGD